MTCTTTCTRIGVAKIDGLGHARGTDYDSFSLERRRFSKISILLSACCTEAFGFAHELPRSRSL